MAERSENILSNLGEKFTDELAKTVQQVLIQNDVKKNSQLVDSVEFVYQRDSILMYVNEYYRAVSEGRKPLAKKVPIYALLQFIKQYNITSAKYSQGQLAYVMQNSIYKNGIQGKHFLEQVSDTVTDTVEVRVANNLEELIADGLYAAFTIK